MSIIICMHIGKSLTHFVKILFEFFFTLQQSSKGAYDNKEVDEDASKDEYRLESPAENSPTGL